MVANLGLAKPLVVLNACQIGRSAMSLTDIGGWAARFLRAGGGGIHRRLLVNLRQGGS